MISIHASRGGSDIWYADRLKTHLEFQSTLPAGEATFEFFTCWVIVAISIHASRGGSDREADRNGSDVGFQSTLPAGEATLRGRPAGQKSRHNFNPRFPRGKRQKRSGPLTGVPAFQSTLPAGEATADEISKSIALYISIHASRGGSDDCLDLLPNVPDISIHASRGGSDPGTGSSGSSSRFQSTLPAGEATNGDITSSVAADISIHASRGGSDSDFGCT